jgi:hypothetical protein
MGWSLAGPGMESTGGTLTGMGGYFVFVALPAFRLVCLLVETIPDDVHAELVRELAEFVRAQLPQKESPCNSAASPTEFAEAGLEGQGEESDQGDDDTLMDDEVLANTPARISVSRGGESC